MAVVLSFDPDDDRQPQLLASRPSALVQHVGLDQGPKALHGRVVAGGTNPVHRADHGVPVQRMAHLAGPELAAPVGMQNAADNVLAVEAASDHGTVEGIDGELGGHPGR